MTKLISNFRNEFSDYSNSGLFQRCALIAIAVYLVYTAYIDQASFHTIASGFLTTLWLAVAIWQASAFLIYALCLILRFIPFPSNQ